jgi:hypothetical protein
MFGFIVGFSNRPIGQNSTFTTQIKEESGTLQSFFIFIASSSLKASEEAYVLNAKFH